MTSPRTGQRRPRGWPVCTGTTGSPAGAVAGGASGRSVGPRVPRRERVAVTSPLRADVPPGCSGLRSSGGRAREVPVGPAVHSRWSVPLAAPVSSARGCAQAPSCQDCGPPSTAVTWFGWKPRSIDHDGPQTGPAETQIRNAECSCGETSCRSERRHRGGSSVFCCFESDRNGPVTNIRSPEIERCGVEGVEGGASVQKRRGRGRVSPS